MDLRKLAVPWYPSKISDLDRYASRVLSFGAELDSDHPGFTDPTYRERRKMIADIAIKYRQCVPFYSLRALPLLSHKKRLGTKEKLFSHPPINYDQLLDSFLYPCTDTVLVQITAV